jgi:hypothetical protein
MFTVMRVKSTSNGDGREVCTLGRLVGLLAFSIVSQGCASEADLHAEAVSRFLAVSGGSEACIRDAFADLSAGDTRDLLRAIALLRPESVNPEEVFSNVVALNALGKALECG